MRKFNFKNSIVVGGILDFNENNILLRKRLIEDGLMIHSCNDYYRSLEIIKKASSEQKDRLKLLTKVYYKYPDIYHRRFRPIYDQLKEQKERLGFVPTEWSIQICCYCSIKDLLSQKAQSFFSRINNEFGIRKIFLEIYPIYGYKVSDIKLLNSFYKGKSCFGVVGYQNAHNRVFNEVTLNELAINSIEVIFIGLLGKGSQNKIKNISNTKYSENEFIDYNLHYFLSNLKKFNNIKGITNFSSINQYENLQKRFSNLQKSIINRSLDYNPKNKLYLFNDYDHYGGYYPIKKYFKNPILFLSRLKYVFYSFLKSNKFSNNFFG